MDFPPDPAIAVIFRGGADLGSGDDGDSEVRDAATSYPGESERLVKQIKSKQHGWSASHSSFWIAYGAEMCFCWPLNPPPPKKKGFMRGSHD